MDGNGGKGKAEDVIKQLPAPKTQEEKQKAELERKKGQYLFLKLVEVLGIKPIKEEDMPTRWAVIGFGDLQYDLTEVLEASLKMHEVWINKKTQL